MKSILIFLLMTSQITLSSRKTRTKRPNKEIKVIVLTLSEEMLMAFRWKYNIIKKGYNK